MASESPDRILAWLRAGRTPVSGEELAERLGISRAAVFKHIEALRARGYGIEARHAQGYVLAAGPDRLDANELGPHLTGTWRRVEWRAELDSTQRLGRDLARAGAEEGTLVLAETQTAGRGRLGRSWHSPAGVNVYLSVVLRPELPPGTVPQIALVAGLAVARAVESVGVAAAIKWPNDVLVDGRKVCGILTEMDAELERVQSVVVGIGVNVNGGHEAFPPELRATATSLALASGARVDRPAFAGRLVGELETQYRRFLTGGFGALRADWEARSALTGGAVTVATPDGAVAGRVLGLDDDGALRVTDRAGVVRRVVAGEVTLRGDEAP